jgi:hypothetical protein
MGMIDNWAKKYYSGLTREQIIDKIQEELDECDPDDCRFVISDHIRFLRLVIYMLKNMKVD